MASGRVSKIATVPYQCRSARMAVSAPELLPSVLRNTSPYEICPVMNARKTACMRVATLRRLLSRSMW